MKIDALSSRTPEEFRAAVEGFDSRYADDWDLWVAVDTPSRARLFSQILRRWRAARPRAVRRPRSEAMHAGPFIEDLLDEAAGPLARLGGLTVQALASRTEEQGRALDELWAIFSGLAVGRPASCVGITKAVLLLTDGRIGPALDSNVRKQLGMGRRRPETSAAWVEVLDAVAADVSAFESQNGPIAAAAPPQFAHLACGRLYDMALGPRQRPRREARRGLGRRRRGGRPPCEAQVVAADVPRRSARVRRRGLMSFTDGGEPVTDRIKRRFAQTGSTTRIPMLRGGSFAASIGRNGITVSNLRAQPLLPWAVFEEAVTLLRRNGGRASRGDAMKYRLGDDGLSLDSVEGHIAAAVYGRREGDSVFRRITPVACILVWAGVCRHSPGELVLLR